MSMPHILNYSRNRCTSVEQIDENTLRSVCTLQDTLTEARVEITVRLPDLEITDVSSHFTRALNDACHTPPDSLKKVIGVRIGPGMLKIIPGLIGENYPCQQLTFMVEECCHGVILAFTKDTLMSRPRGMHSDVDYYRNMVLKNIRLYNRCAAFAEGSPIVEGIDPP